ncbi:hypothetical protein LSAT2_013910 [Lamellibrachia satsuma]|nr:hypothetical protein LSAT2_013910 [Lamellibrachia satsuma]
MDNIPNTKSLTRRQKESLHGKQRLLGTLLRKQIDGLQHGTEYTAVVYTLSGPHTSSGESTKITTTPSTVADIKEEETGRSTTQLKVSWTKPEGGLTGYQLEISPNHGAVPPAQLSVDK